LRQKYVFQNADIGAAVYNALNDIMN